MNDTAKVNLGPREATDGLEVTIINCYLSEDDCLDADYTTITHTCHGVEEMDVQDPWDMGTLDPACHIGLTFTNGHKERLVGTIVDVEPEGDE